MSKSACEKYWWQDPAVLINPERKTATLCPRIGCRTDAVNALTRTFIIVLFVGVLAYMYEGGWLCLIVAGITAVILSLPAVVQLMTPIDEAFEDAPESRLTDRVVVLNGGIKDEPWTKPSAANPFMNVLLPEYEANPLRGPAVSMTSDVKEGLDDYFKTQWFSDGTDVFGRNQGQRQFITMPSTTIPNDRESFQNWLYKIPGKTCKEGGRQACLPGTDGGPVTWLNFDS
jgi:hypothetical protein